MTSRIADRRLYITDLLHRLIDMELGAVNMSPLAYRVLARRLQQAAAGFPEGALAGNFGPFNPMLALALENRHFDEHGQLRGPRGPSCRKQARALFRRLGVRVPG